MDFDGVQGYNPFFGGSSFGNTHDDQHGGVQSNDCPRCRTVPGHRHALGLLLSDFNIVEAFADLTTIGRLASRCASSSTTRRTWRPK